MTPQQAAFFQSVQQAVAAADMEILTDGAVHPVAPAAPTLTAPTTGSTLLTAGPYTVSATSTDGDLDRIDWVLDPGGSEVVVATDSAAPYSQTWSPTQHDGAHTLVARAVRGGLHTDSAAINITLAYYDPSADASIYSWYRETSTDDGAGNANPWTDKTANVRHLSCTTQARRVNIITADAGINNQTGVQATGGDSAHFQTEAAADRKFLHDGTLYTEWFVFNATGAGTTQTLRATTSVAANSSTGSRLLYDGTNGAISFRVAKGSAPYAIQYDSAAGTVAASALHIVQIQSYYTSSVDNGWIVWLDGELLASGNWSAAPAAGNAASVMFVFSDTNGATNSLTAKVAEFGQSKSGVSMPALSAYLMSRYS